MPELPEVETIRRGLSPILEGARFTRVLAHRPDLRFPLPAGFCPRLEGAVVRRLERRGKYLLAQLDRGETLLMHLGMTGRFVIEGSEKAAPGEFALAAPADPAHAHIVFETEGGHVVTYFDARRFGFMDLWDSADMHRHPRLAHMGPEPLDRHFTGAYLVSAFRGRRQNPKTLLLDQRVVAGLGNIYVCEALHRAGVSPLRPAGALEPAQARRLARAVREVLAAAILQGGSTLRDYAAADGALGYFQHSFAAYGREGESCTTRRCQGRIARVVQAGRSTFYCPQCQA
jgi:formamidopyrimidine-DNA glycosylase